MTDQHIGPTLAALYAQHHGKVSDKWSLYVSTYDATFGRYAASPIRLLEIGIQNGGSLAIWGAYFRSATVIVGCDINPACNALHYDDPRIHVVVGDANTDATQARIEALSPAFDLIIDDGSHRSGDIIRSFARYFPKLADGGLFVVEDLHCSYWDAFDGGLFDPWSSMAFLKRLADVVNHEHWGVPYARADILRSFESRYGIVLGDALLSGIHSVEFLNSLCFIRKKPAAENMLGPRVVVGEDAIVYSRMAADGSAITFSDQGGNPWSVLPPLPEDELLSLRQALRDAEAAARAVSEDAKAQQARHESELAAQCARTAAQVYALRLAGDELRNAVDAKTGQLRIAQAFSRSLLAELEGANARVARLADAETRQAARVEGLEQEAAASRAMVEQMRQSTSWRVTAPVRWTGQQLRRVRRTARLASVLAGRPGGLPKAVRGGVRALLHGGPSELRLRLRALECELDIVTPQVGEIPGGGAGHWTSEQMEEEARRIFAEQQAELAPDEATRMIGTFSQQPLMSVIMPVYRTPLQWLRRAVESIQEQYYSHWELCVVDDCSPTDEQRALLREMAAADPRIKVHAMEANGGISAASNAALRMARGDYVVLVDHDDELTPDALFRMVEEINRRPDVDFLYSDECKIDATPARKLYDFVLKPDWSPELMFNMMMTGHLTAYRKSLIDELGGFRSEYDFSQDYDLALRVSEATDRIVHVERILYFWRSIPGSAASGDKDYARGSNIAALNDALERRNIPGQAIPLPHTNYVHIAIPAETTRVSIIIPSDSFPLLNKALQSIREGTDYPNYEVVVVCNGPLMYRLADKFTGWGQLRFVQYDKEYNFSDKCNEGAKSATGDIVVFYNDDVFPLQKDWIECLIEYLWVPGVGGVSPKLLHEDDTIQYAGMIVGTPGLCGTAYNNAPRNQVDAFLSMHRYVRNVSLLSGACCAFRADLFWKVGGFDAVNTPDGHSDMDLSFRLMEAGYRCVYTPHAVLRHVGNHSWGSKRHKYKADIHVLRRWGAYVSRDPYFTNTMKRVLYQDFRFNYRIHAEHVVPQQPVSGPDVLFVSHELSLTGAPRMLFYGALTLQQAGGFPVVVSRQDGPLREELEHAGMVVIIDESIASNHFLFERFAGNFDLAIVNTIALAETVRQLSAINILRTIWWVHEAQSLADKIGAVQNMRWDRVHLLCVSNYARQFVPDGIDVEVIHNGIPDQPVSGDPSVGPKRLTFVLSGTIEPRKGQDILVGAIALLPQQIRAQCRFVLTGKLWEDHLEYQEYWAVIQARMAGLPEVEYLGLLDHQKQLHLIASADVLVCASRDESFSLIVMEAAMLAKPIILNENVGSCAMFDSKSCFVFESGNAASLATQLLAAHERRDDLPRMGDAARKVFEQEWTLDSFGRRFLAMIHDQIIAAADQASPVAL
ncbi:glycosyltransferase [Rhodopila sp.]|uniref:glycosyltransferase n=1 Tax=Rhodopila sp. TaxID=2480087 RepID=UPI002C3D65F3|nr:glycosyltransferase [Rhodopila sp.]HVZ10777.1 glycosyltransferase [Rhodopila sp.]